MSYRRMLGLLLAAALLSACAAPLLMVGAAAGGTVVVASDRRTAGQIVDDQGIELKVNASIGEDRSLSANTHVNITSYNGIVLLSGEALNEEYAGKAGQIAAKTVGVRYVHNELVIGPLSDASSRANDTWLSTKLKTKMIETKDVDASKVKVVTEKATAFLMGLVTHAEGDKASRVAAEVPGIKRVVRMFEYID